MKKFTLLLFVLSSLINAGFAQRLHPAQKVNINNPKAQELIHDYKIMNPLNRLIYSFALINSPEKSLKSAATIKLDSVVVSMPYSGTVSWQTVDKKVFSYDSENRLVKIEASDGITSFFPEMAEFVYNDTGKVDSIKFWFKIDGPYEMLAFNDFVYDDTGRLSQATTHFRDYDKWTILYRLTYSYNEAGKPVDLLMEDGWIKDGLLVPSFHHLTYNSRGQLINYRATNLYEYEINYEWGTNGNLVKESFEDFSWNEKKYSLYYYDSVGNRIRVERYGNYINLNNWSLYDANTYSYSDLSYNDLVDLNISLLMTSNEPDLIGYQPKNLISSSNKNGKKYDYYYSSIVEKQGPLTGIQNIKNAKITVFPNPATDQVTFTWNASYDQLYLKIFGLTGACVIDMEIQSNEPVQLNKLTSGVYLYKLADKENILQSGKLVIR